MIDEKKLTGLLGLALWSGNVVLGTDSVLVSVRLKKARAVLIDERASDNTRKKLEDSCAYHQVPLIKINAELIEKATGKQGRKAAALLHSNISEEILRHAIDLGNGSSAGNNAGVHLANG